LARKGAYELRAALRLIDQPPPLRICGRNLEAPDFWSGMKTELAGEDPFGDAAAVVLPAWVEHQPRRLLDALARGIPVIATPACGLTGWTGVTEVPAGDFPALAEALQRVLGSRAW
jgi:glycosyltransferase involved in cell wall biosynthesis